MGGAPRSRTGKAIVKLLVCAYACNPFRGSEEAVGWEWVTRLARDHDVTVLTAGFNQREIEEQRDASPRIRYCYVPARWWDYQPVGCWKKIEQSALKPLMNFAYVAWQKRALRVAREILSTERFDVVHQLTYVGYRFPGRLWTLGLPFVWGPIGGLENTPWPLLPAMGVRGATFYAGRNLVNAAQRRWLRSPRRALEAAGPGVIAATGGTARVLQDFYGRSSTVISEVVAPTGMDTVQLPRRETGQPLQLVWSGLHLPGKALNLLLRALTRLPAGTEWRLDVLGDGPLREGWIRLARRLAIDDKCQWYGQVSRAHALQVMGNAHVLVISSLKDLTSTVLVEGLALGLPVVCPDHCGFSDAITDACGIKVPLKDVESLVAGLAAAITELAEDEPRRHQMGWAALERARDYRWENKKKRLDRVYQETIRWHEQCQGRLPSRTEEAASPDSSR